jgi:hypothetical protein
MRKYVFVGREFGAVVIAFQVELRGQAQLAEVYTFAAGFRE